MLDLVIHKEGGQEKLISLNEATISLAYFDSIRFMMPMAGTVSLHGAEIFIERHPNGKWVVQGFELFERESSRGSEELIDLVLSADIELIDSHIHWRDFTGRSRDLDFDNASVRLENELGTQYFEIDTMLPADLGERLRIVARIDGDLRDFHALEAHLHVGGQGLIFDNWATTTRVREFIQGSGKLDIAFWTHINKGSITRFTSIINANGLVLENINDRTKSWRAESLQTNIFWRKLNQGWRLDVRDINLRTANSIWPENTDIVISTDLDDWRILASYLKPADMLPMLDVLPDKFDVSAVSSYAGYVPGGEFYNFEAIFSAAGNPDLQLSTGFTDIDIVLADRDISIFGLDGELTINSYSSEVMIDASNVVAHTGGFLRWPLQLDTVRGKLDIQLDAGNIMVQTPGLFVKNRHIETVTRLFTQISTDKKVFLDIQSDFANGQGKYAHRYVPASILHEGLVAWLDNAFVGGYVPS